MSERDKHKWDQRYREGAYAEIRHPSAFVSRWAGDRVDAAAAAAPRALDVACGRGRNALYLAQAGYQVDAVDISEEALARARSAPGAADAAVNWLARDLDDGFVPAHRYDLIVVIRYVNLPLVTALVGHLAVNGRLLVEQHLITDAAVAGPGNPRFRVVPGELAAAVAPLRVLHTEEGLFEDPDGRCVALARIAAQRAG